MSVGAALHRLAEGLRATAGGLFFRPYIRRLFRGKDWFESVTAWALVLYFSADILAAEACARGLLELEACSTAARALEVVGEVFVVLGVRRARAAP